MAQKLFTQNLILMSLTLVSTVYSREFRVYWNIPSFMCRHYKTPIANVTQQFGILQNYNDNFRGNHIAILYDPGNFPAILENSTTKNFIHRNKGVPQEGDLHDHLRQFENDLQQLIPDNQFSGLAVIDFESWRPIYRQNFGALQPYKDLSTFIERQRHPFWNEHRIDTEAANRFEKSAKNFMLETLLRGKQLRPKASWGYYGLPFCFNGYGKNIGDCANHVKRENDGMQWLIDDSDIVLPSVYMNSRMPRANQVPMIEGRIREAMRMANNAKRKPKIYVYHRFNFVDTREYLSEIEQLEALSSIKRSGADGIILWGSSSDLDTRNKCTKFYEYLVNTLGPVIESLNPTISVQSSSNSIED